MLVVPENYNEIRSGKHIVQWKLVINGDDYDQSYIQNGSGTIEAGLFDKFAIGNAVTRVLTVTVDLKGDLRTVDVYFRLYKNATTYTDWIPKGKYFVSLQEDIENGLTKLTCYDAMYKTIAQYQRSSGIESSYTDAIVSRIATRIGVTVDTTTATYLSAHRFWVTNYYLMNADTTMRDYLTYIANALCGNFFIDDYGHLKLWHYGMGYNETNYLVDNNNDAITFGGDRIVVLT